MAASPATTALREHGPDCVCESCMAGEKPLPLTREEFQAVIDRAYNAGVKHGRLKERRGV